MSSVLSKKGMKFSLANLKYSSKLKESTKSSELVNSLSLSRSCNRNVSRRDQSIPLKQNPGGRMVNTWKQVKP